MGTAAFRTSWRQSAETHRARGNFVSLAADGIERSRRCKMLRSPRTCPQVAKRRRVKAVQKVPLISPGRRPIETSNSNRIENGLLIKNRLSDGPARQAKPQRRLRDKRGKSELKKGDI